MAAIGGRRRGRRMHADETPFEEDNSLDSALENGRLPESDPDGPQGWAQPGLFGEDDERAVRRGLAPHGGDPHHGLPAVPRRAREHRAERMARIRDEIAESTHEDELGGGPEIG